MSLLKNFIVISVVGYWFAIGNLEYALGAVLGAIFLILLDIRNTLRKEQLNGR